MRYPTSESAVMKLLSLAGLVRALTRSGATLCACLLAGLVLVPATSLGQVTKTYPFNDSNNYSLSKQDTGGDTTGEEIVVQDGVAKLVPDSSTTYEDTTEELANQAIFDGTKSGTEGSLTISGSSGSFLDTATYTSPVIDGGGTNPWKRLAIKATATPIPSQYVQPLSATDPEWDGKMVAFFRFEGNYNDSSGNGVTMLPYDLSFSSVAKVGAACALAGTYGRGLVNGLVYSGSGAIDDLTIEGWIVPGPKSMDTTTYILDAGPEYYRFGVLNKKLRITLTSQSGTSKTLVGTTDLGTSNWYHVAATYDKSTGTASLYLDGELEARQEIFSPNTSVGTGASVYPFLNAIQGGSYANACQKIDEFIIANTALSQRDIRRHYEASGYPGFLQVRSADDPATLNAQTFVGPTGTGSYYTNSNRYLTPVGGFDPNHQYIQYKCTLVASPSGDEAPTVSAIGVSNGADTFNAYTVGDFQQGTQSGTQIIADAPDRSFVGLRSNPLGGIYASGTFTSRVFDRGGALTWDTLSWDEVKIAEVDASETGLVGLWHFDTGWDDVKTGSTLTPSGSASLGDTRWIGTGAAQFNGPGDSADLASPSFTLGEQATVMFWIKPGPGSGTLLRQGWTAGGTDSGWTIDYGQVDSQSWQPLQSITWASGDGSGIPETSAASTPQGSVLPGRWSHVAIVKNKEEVEIYIDGILLSERTLPTEDIVYSGSTALTVGAGYTGVIDELAVFSGRALDSQDIGRYYNFQKDGFGKGELAFQVRMGSETPLTGPFVGPGDDTTAYFDTAAGASLGGLTQDKYLQYRVYFKSIDQLSMPALKRVDIDYSSGTFSDVLRDNFEEGSYDDRTRWFGDDFRLENLAVSGPVQTPDQSRGLKAVWHFDGDLTESSGQVTTTDPQLGSGSITFADTSVVGTQAATFDGKAAVGIFAADAPAVGKSDFALMGWFRTDMRVDGDFLVRGSSGRYLRLGVDGDDTGGIVFSATGLAGGTGTVTIGQNYNDGNWHHAAVVRERGTLLLYIDGVQYYDETLSSVIDYSSGTINPWLLIGAGVYSGGDPTSAFVGDIDEVLLFDRGLSAREVATYAGNAPFYASPGDQIYTSKPFDNGTPIGWIGLAWGEGTTGYGNAIGTGRAGQPVDAEEQGLAALFHFDNDWSESAAASLGITASPESTDATFDASDSVLGDASATFDGDDHALITSASVGEFGVDSDGLTLSLWVKWDAAAPSPGDGDTPIFSNGTGPGTYGLYMTESGQPAFVVQDGSNPQIRVVGSSHIASGQWYQMTVTATASGTVALYVNGELEAQENASSLTAFVPTTNAYLAKSGASGASTLQWTGLIDELAVYSIQLSGADVAAAYQNQSGHNGMVGLWHLDDPADPETDPDVVLNSISAAGEGTTTGALEAAGVFAGALNCTADPGAKVAIPYFPGLDVSSVTISFWVKPTGLLGGSGNCVFVGRGGANPPFAVRTFGAARDMVGLEIYDGTNTYGNEQVSFPGDMVLGEWNHLLFSYDGASGTIKSYCNGKLAAVENTAGSSLATSPGGLEMMGAGTAGGSVGGTIDEVVVLGRAVNELEAKNLYARGATKVKFQVSVDQGVTWTDDKGNAGGFIQNTPTPLELGDVYRHFQYRAIVSSDDFLVTPEVQGVDITKAFYPDKGPSVSPIVKVDAGGAIIEDQGLAHKGYLTAFLQEIGVETQIGGYIRYRVSNDNQTWYYWDDDWIDSSTIDGDYLYSQATTNTADQINGVIDTFYEKFGPGTFYFKAFLDSTGAAQVALDTVTIDYSEGRLQVTAPNGGEDWWIGQSYDIQWSTVGKTSNTWDLYYSTPNPAEDPAIEGDELIWTQFETGVAVSGTVHSPDDGGADYSYSWELPPELAARVAPAGPTEQFRIKIIAADDPSLYDQSDADSNALLPTYDVTFPSATDVIMTGNLYDITWNYVDDPGNATPPEEVTIEYSLDAGATWIICEDNTGAQAVNVPAHIGTDTTVGLFSNWQAPNSLPVGVTPPGPAPMLIRITDERTGYAAYVYNISDQFDLKLGFDVIRADGDDTDPSDNILYTGYQEEVKWKASNDSSDSANVSYSLIPGADPAVAADWTACQAIEDPVTPFADTLSNIANVQGIENVAIWEIPEVTREDMMDGTYLYSYDAKIRVDAPAISYARDVSNDVFTLAGITSMAPYVERNSAGALVHIDKLRLGSEFTVKWVTAGAPAGDTAIIEVRQKLDPDGDGVYEWQPWITIKDIDGNPADGILNKNAELSDWTGGISNPDNWVGLNSFNWYIDPAEFALSPDTEMRITSQTAVPAPEPGGTFAQRLTQTTPLIIAGMKLVDPLADALLQVRKPYEVIYEASGAEDTLTLFYAVSEVPFPEDVTPTWRPVPGNDGLPITITNDVNDAGPQTFFITVPDSPARYAKLKLAERTGSLFVDSETIIFAGVRVDRPVEDYNWLIAELETVDWTSAYTVDPAKPTQNQLILEYTLDAYKADPSQWTWYQAYSGVPFANKTLNWQPIAMTGATQDMRPTPSARVRITAMNPPDIDGDGDFSDELIDGESPTFTIAGVKITRPALNDQLTIGTLNNSIIWFSAGSGDTEADIYYSALGNFDDETLIQSYPNNESAFNQSVLGWDIDADVVPSQFAKVKVIVDGPGGRFEETSQYFTLRGIKVMSPSLGDTLVQGTSGLIEWRSAGLLNDPGATVNIYYTPTGDQADEITLATGIALDNGTPGDGVGSYSWTVDPYQTEPSAPDGGTIEPKFRVQVVSGNAADNGFEALSDPITVRGIKINDPAGGTSLVQGQTTQVNWVSADVGAIANIYYSFDGNFDVNNPGDPIHAGGPLDVTSGSYTWNIGADIIPASGTAILTIVSDTGVFTSSFPFSVEGLTVEQPNTNSLWAVGSPATIRWKAAGTGNFEIVAIANGGAEQVLYPDLASTVREQVIPSVPELDGTQDPDTVEILVRDKGAKGYVGSSGEFLVYSGAQIGISSPAQDDLIYVGDYFTIEWSKAGVVSAADTFIIQREQADGSWFQIYPGINPKTNAPYEEPAFNAVDNTFSLDWFVGDLISSGQIDYRIRITDTLDTPETTDDLVATTGVFKIGPRFELSFPNGGETLYSLAPTNVSWATVGSAGPVEISYSLAAPLFPDGSYTVIDAAAPDNGSGTSLVGSPLYEWIVPDLQAAQVKFRVRHVASGSQVVSQIPFEIRYYNVTWEIVDNITGEALDQLSVDDSSGWAAVNLASPQVRTYPYGTFTTTWDKANYFPNTVLNWKADADKTIQVRMNISQTDKEFHVKGNFDYDAQADAYRITTWLERDGKIIDATSSSTVTVYDDAGSVAAGTPLASSSPSATGVFRLDWDTSALDKNAVYFAKVDVIYNSATYSSGVAYSLRIPVIQEEIRSGVAGLVTSVGKATDSTTGTNPDSLQAKVNDLVTDLGTVATDVGEVKAAVVSKESDGTVVNLTEKLLGDPLVSADSGFIGNIRDEIAAVKADTGNLSGGDTGFSIVSRSRAVKTGTSITIRVQTTTGKSSQIYMTVYKPPYDDGTGTIINNDPIDPALQDFNGFTEVGGTGIYEMDLALTYNDGTGIVDWPPGEYTVEVTSKDSEGKVISRDSTLLTVSTVDLDTLAESQLNDAARTLLENFAASGDSLATTDGQLNQAARDLLETFAASGDSLATTDGQLNQAARDLLETFAATGDSLATTDGQLNQAARDLLETFAASGDSLATTDGQLNQAARDLLETFAASGDSLATTDGQLNQAARDLLETFAASGDSLATTDGQLNQAARDLLETFAASGDSLATADGQSKLDAKLSDVKTETDKIAAMATTVSNNLDAKLSEVKTETDKIAAVKTDTGDILTAITSLNGGIRLNNRFERATTGDFVDVVAISKPGQIVTGTLYKWGADPTDPTADDDFYPVSVADTAFDLTESTSVPGGYYASRQLPADEGEYMLGVQFTDTEGNTFSDSMTFTVSAAAGDLTTLAQDVKDILDSVGDISISGRSLQAQIVDVKDTVDTNLDASVSSRATQGSVDAVKVDTGNIAGTVASNLDAAVSSRATQGSVDAVKVDTGSIAGTVASNLDAAVSSRATQGSVDAVKVDTGNIAGTVASNLDAAVSSRATQVSVDAVKVDTGSIAGTVASNLDVAVSSRAAQDSIDSLQTDLRAISDTLDNVDLGISTLVAKTGGSLTILDRYTSVTTGDTIAIRARRVLTSPDDDGPLQISVFDADNNLLKISTNDPDNPDDMDVKVGMKEVPDEDVFDDADLSDAEKATWNSLTRDVYEYQLTLDKEWGLGDFTVVVTEPDNPNPDGLQLQDSFVLTVTDASIDTVTAVIGDLGPNGKTISENAEEAATKASRAKTQATTAAFRVTDVRQWLANDGDGTEPGEIRELLIGLRNKVETLQSAVGKMPLDVKAEMTPINTEMIKRITELQNVAQLLVVAAKPEALNTAMVQIAESRKLVEELRALIEKSINAPVVESNWSEEAQPEGASPEGGEGEPVAPDEDTVD